MSEFPTLTGYYRFIFLYLEPLSTIYPAFHVFVYPGAQGFYDDLIPGSTTSEVFEPRSRMAICQLANCYFLLSLMSSFVFRAVRDSVPNTFSQERLVGTVLKVLAIADVTHIIVSYVGLPEEVRWDFGSWNAMTHGNISFVLLLLFSRSVRSHPGIPAFITELVSRDRSGEILLRACDAEGAGLLMVVNRVDYYTVFATNALV